MQIKKNGWAYRVAYGLMDEYKRPTKVNLCPFFWKFLWMLLGGWPLLWFANTITNCGAYIFGFFFGYRATSDEEWQQCKTLTIPYKTWPTTKSGKRIWPIWFVVAGLAIWLVCAKGKTVAIATTKTVSTLLFWKWFGGIVGCVILILLTVGFFKSEPWRLFQAWCKAKKEKVCPVIEVVE